MQRPQSSKTSIRIAFSWWHNDNTEGDQEEDFHRSDAKELLSYVFYFF